MAVPHLHSHPVVLILPPLQNDLSMVLLMWDQVGGPRFAVSLCTSRLVSSLNMKGEGGRGEGGGILSMYSS